MPISHQILKEESFQPRKCSQRMRNVTHISNYSDEVQKTIMDMKDVKKAQNYDKSLNTKSRHIYEKILGKSPQMVSRLCHEKSAKNSKIMTHDKNLFDSNEWISYQTNTCRNEDEFEREFQLIENKRSSKTSNCINTGHEPQDSASYKSLHRSVPFSEDENKTSSQSFQKNKNTIGETTSDNYFGIQRQTTDVGYGYIDETKHVLKNSKRFRKQESKKNLAERYLKNQKEFVDGIVHDWDKTTQLGPTCQENGTDEQLRKHLRNFATSLKDPSKIQMGNSFRKQTEWDKYAYCPSEKPFQDKRQKECDIFSSNHKINNSRERGKFNNLAHTNEFDNNKSQYFIPFHQTSHDPNLDNSLKIELKKFAKTLRDPYMDNRSKRCTVKDLEKEKPLSTRKRIPSSNSGHITQKLRDYVSHNINGTVHIRFSDTVAQDNISSGSRSFETDISAEEDENLKTELVNFAKSLNDRHIDRHCKSPIGPMKNRKCFLPSRYKDRNFNSVNEIGDTEIFQLDKVAIFRQNTSGLVPPKGCKESEPLKSESNLKTDLRNFMKEFCANKIDLSKSNSNRFKFKRQYLNTDSEDIPSLNCKANHFRRKNNYCNTEKNNSTRTLCVSNNQKDQLLTDDIQTRYNSNEPNNQNSSRSRRNKGRHCLNKVNYFNDHKSVKMCVGDFSFLPEDGGFASNPSMAESESDKQQPSEVDSSCYEERGGLFEDRGDSSGFVKGKIRRNRITNVFESDCNKNEGIDVVLKLDDNQEKVAMKDTLDNSASIKNCNKEAAVCTNLISSSSSLKHRLSSATELKTKHLANNRITVEDGINSDIGVTICENDTTEFLHGTIQMAKHGRRFIKFKSVTQSPGNKNENALVIKNTQTNSENKCDNTEESRSSAKENSNTLLSNKRFQGSMTELNNMNDVKLNSDETLENIEESPITKTSCLENSNINIEHERNSELDSTSPGLGKSQNLQKVLSLETFKQSREELPEEHSKSTISAFLDSQKSTDYDKQAHAQESPSEKVRRWEEGFCQEERSNSVASSNSSKEQLKKFNLGSAMASTLYGSPKKNCDSSKNQGHEYDDPVKDVTSHKGIHRRRQWNKPSISDQNVYKQNSLDELQKQVESNCERQVQQIFMDGKDLNYENHIRHEKQDSVKMFSGHIQTNLNQLLCSNHQTGNTDDDVNFNTQQAKGDSSGNVANVYPKFPTVLNYIHPIGFVDPNAFMSYIDCNVINGTHNFKPEKASNNHIQEVNSQVLSDSSTSPVNLSQPKIENHHKFIGNEPSNSLKNFENEYHSVETGESKNKKRSGQTNYDGNSKKVEPTIVSQNMTTCENNIRLNKDTREKRRHDCDLKDQINRSREIIKSKLLSGKDMASVMYGGNWEDKPAKMKTTSSQAFNWNLDTRNDQQPLKNENNSGISVDSINNELPSNKVLIAAKTNCKEVFRKRIGIIPGLEDTDAG